MTIGPEVIAVGLAVINLAGGGWIAFLHLKTRKSKEAEDEFKKAKKTLFEKIDQVRDKATTDRESMIKQGHSDREEMIEKLHAIKLEAAEKYITIPDHRAGEENLKKDIDSRIGSMERHFDSRFDTLTTLITNSLTKDRKQGD